MELQTIFCHVAFRIIPPFKTQPGDRTVITVMRQGETKVVLDTEVPLAFDALVLIDPASWVIEGDKKRI